MYVGKIAELGETASLFSDPKHPYTRALLAAVPNPDPDVAMDATLSGEVADPGNPPPGCSFHRRYGECMVQCKVRHATANGVARKPPGLVSSVRELNW
jgi:oligopeptide/dipeptide ABC transporter ATP-binding protein